MIRVALVIGAMAALAGCADDEKQPQDPMADVKDEGSEPSPAGETVVVEESATGGSETIPDEPPVGDDYVEATPESESAVDNSQIGSGLMKLKLQKPVETIAAQPAAPAKKATSKFKAPKAAKGDGKALWVFVDKLVVRSKPSRGASQVGQVEYGAQVPVLEAKDGFVKIGEDQWVARRFLTDRQSKFIPAH
jgi:hypothetical protein